MPPTKTTTETLVGGAKGSYSIDLATNTVLAEKNPNTRLQIASLTKLMTAYIILKNHPNLDEEVKIKAINTQLGDATMGISVGETIKLRYLLEGLLLNSGSDAATALAAFDSGDSAKFVEKLNLAADKIGLKDAHFASPVGWDDSQNYSTAKDLTELTRILLRNNFFKETVAKSQDTVSTTTGRQVYLHNTNTLLAEGGYLGVKTGYTYEAGECLISLKKLNGHEILTVVLGSTSRFSESESINSWIFTHFLW